MNELNVATSPTITCEFYVTKLLIVISRLSSGKTFGYGLDGPGSVPGVGGE